MQNNNLEKSGHFKTSCVRLKLEVSHIFFSSLRARFSSFRAHFGKWG